MSKPYPKEFGEDVVRVARKREPGVTIEQIAKDFGLHEGTLRKWLRQADLNVGNLTIVDALQSMTLFWSWSSRWISFFWPFTVECGAPVGGEFCGGVSA